MSIFKKLFGGGDKKNGRDEARPLIARPPRVRVTPLHRILFHRNQGGGREAIALGNISTKGMGLLRSQTPDSRLGLLIMGELELNDKGFRVESEVRQQTDHIVGCQFSGELDVLAKAIEEYFRIEILGLMLNPVDQAFLKRDPNGRVSWFTDGRQNEVYFTADENGILSFHLSFLGNYIEGGRERGVRAGHIVEDTSFGQSKHKGAALLDLSDTVSKEILDMGRLLIENVEKMPADYGKALTDLLVLPKK